MTSKRTVTLGFGGDTLPMYRTFAGQRYKYSLLNPSWGGLSKNEGQKRAKAARDSGWSIRIVKVKAPLQRINRESRAPVTEYGEAYALYERKNHSKRSKRTGPCCLSEDIKKKPWDITPSPRRR